MKITELSYINR